MSYFRNLERSERSKAGQEKKKPRITLCLPTRGMLNIKFVQTTLFDLYTQPLFDMTMQIVAGNHSVDCTRNIAARHAKEEPDSEYLFWLDDDMLFSNGIQPHQALKMLYDLNEPIVTGLARNKTNFGYSAWRNNSQELLTEEDVKESKIIDVAGAGLYCCLVKREVFDKMKYPYFDTVCLENRTRGMDIIGEDSYFFSKARELGYKAKLLTSVKLDHICGDIVVNCDGSIQPVRGYT
jgi:hypothetical protein